MVSVAFVSTSHNFKRVFDLICFCFYCPTTVKPIRKQQEPMFWCQNPLKIDGCTQLNWVQRHSRALTSNEHESNVCHVILLPMCIIRGCVVICFVSSFIIYTMERPICRSKRERTREWERQRKGEKLVYSCLLFSIFSTFSIFTCAFLFSAQISIWMRNNNIQRAQMDDSVLKLNWEFLLILTQRQMAIQSIIPYKMLFHNWQQFIHCTQRTQSRNIRWQLRSFDL